MMIAPKEERSSTSDYVFMKANQTTHFLSTDRFKPTLWMACTAVLLVGAVQQPVQARTLAGQDTGFFSTGQVSFYPVGASAFSESLTDDAFKVDQASVTSGFRYNVDGKRGVNVAAEVTEQLSADLYFLSRSKRDHKTELPFAYTTLTPDDHLRLRVGRIPYPIQVYSDFRDIGYIYPSNSTPRLTSFAPMQSVQGFDVRYKLRVGDIQHDLKAYMGSACDDYTFVDGTFGLSNASSWGFSYEPSWSSYQLRLAYHQGETDFKMSDVISMYEGVSTYANIAPLSKLPGISSYVDPTDSVELLSLGGRWDFDSLYLLGEYNHLAWDNELQTTRERWHFMLGGNVTSAFQLYTSYEQIEDELLYGSAETRPAGVALSASYHFSEVLTGVRTLVEGDKTLSGLFLSWDMPRMFNFKAHFNYLDSRSGQDNSLVKLSINTLFDGI
jgi:hypothetical protein